MDEDQYRSAYREMNPTRCYFEKLLLLRYGQCEQAEKLLLAEREAFACKDAIAQQQCRRLLDNLRANARFGEQAQERAPIENVHGTINETVAKYQSLDKISYNEVVKSIINFKLPERKRRSKHKRSDK